MSQHDFEIANQGFPSFRSDLNNGLQALASNSAGATEPSTTFAYQFWYDETTDLLKLRNSDDDAWITLAAFDQTNDEWEIRSAVIQAVDSAGVVIKTDDGTTRLTIADSGAITTQGDLTVGGDLDVSSGTIKLDGNYPVGTYNVALGNTALDDGSLSGGYNTAIGAEALTANTTGSINTAVGNGTLFSNTSGQANIAIGSNALGDNTTGSNNTAVGRAALADNATASSNTAVGSLALLANTTGASNVAVGTDAGAAVTTGGLNTIIGKDAGRLLTTASNNTFIGQGSGYNITTGAKNTIIGRYNGNQNGLDIRTTSNQTIISDGDGKPKIYVSGTGSGYLLADSGANVLTVSSAGAAGSTRFARFNINSTSMVTGTEVGSIQYNGSGTSYLTSSDYRLKENVVNITDAIDRVKALKPTRFNFIHNPDMTVDGFLAHEVQDIVPEAISGTKDEVDGDGNPVMQGIDQSKLVPLLTAALKEAITEIETLKERVTALENQ